MPTRKRKALATYLASVFFIVLLISLMTHLRLRLQVSGSTHGVGNEMGNQNVSGLQEDKHTDSQAPNKSLERLEVSTDAESLQDNNIKAFAEESQDFHGNKKGSEPKNLLETDNHLNQNQSSGGRLQTKSLEALMPTSIGDGGGVDNINLHLEFDSLHEKLANPDTLEPYESLIHQIHNEASTGKEEKEGKISMESEYKSVDKEHDDIYSSASIKDSLVIEGHGNVVDLCDSNDKVNKFEYSDVENQLDGTSTCQLGNVENEGHEEEISVELDISRNNTRDNGSIESFCIEAIQSEIRRVCLGDDSESTEEGVEIKQNGYGQNSISVSDEDFKELADESRFDKNDKLQYDFSVADANEEKKSHAEDGIDDFTIEKALQVDNGEGTERIQLIELSGAIPSSIMEGGIKDLKNEREDTNNYLPLSNSVEEGIGEKTVEETEDIESEEIKQVDKGSGISMRKHEPAATIILEDDSYMNEKETVNLDLIQFKPIEWETAAIEPSPTFVEQLQEAEIERPVIEIKRLEGRDTSNQENCLTVETRAHFQISLANTIAETPGPILEPEKEESKLHPTANLKDTQINEGSSNGSSNMSAFSIDLSREKEPTCDFTKFSSVDEPETDSKIPESGETSNAELNQEKLCPHFDSSETFTFDFESPLVEPAASTTKLKREDISKCPSPYQGQSVEDEIPASKSGETDEQTVNIQFCVSESLRFEVFTLQVKREQETAMQEAPAVEKGKTEQKILNIQTHFRENPEFDLAPKDTEVSTLEAKTEEETSKLEAPASERVERDNENVDIHIHVNERPAFDFVLPVANIEVSVSEMDDEDCVQHPMPHQAMSGKGEVSQTKEISGRSVTTFDQDEEMAKSEYLSGSSCVHFKNPIAETEFPGVLATKEESSLTVPSEREIFALERSYSEKLKTPLLSSVNEETCVLQQASLPMKKTVNEDWNSPKKATATSAEGREKSKSRYSLFSHCMCCTTVIQ